MRIFGRRDKPAVPGGLVGKLNLVNEIASKLLTQYNEIASPSSIRERLQRIDTELREIRLGLDFVRTRTSCYVGDGIVLTYLADEMPIFVNSNDMGGPFNLMNGGRYEEENLAVLLSFVKNDTVFLDIGANVGFFTLKIGRRLGVSGKVYSFEPHPKMSDLLARNIHVNGLGERISCFRFALSDRNATATLQYPAGHLGGGHIDAPGDVSGHTAVDAEIRRLDDVLGPDFRCDLVKMDVEGHEINVLRGMKNIVANSPEIKILFEKLVPEAGTEAALESYFSEFGLDLYGVQPDASLIALDSGEVARWSGYILAGRLGVIKDGLRRARFSVYGGQLLVPNSTLPTSGLLHSAAEQGGMLFHGPYWYLPPGVWRFKFHGNISGAVRFKLLERFGHPVLDFSLEPGESEHVFVMRRDLVYFECAAYAAANQVEVTVERLEFIREG